MDCNPNPNPVHNPSHPEIELHIQAISIIFQNIKSIKYPYILYGYFMDIWIFYGYMDIWIFYGFMDIWIFL